MSPVISVKTILFLLIVLAVLLTIPVLVGVYVYRDARRRGMNGAAWTLVAVLAPLLVGFIIYLLVRGGYSDLECPRCGGGVSERYVVCPHCGARLRLACPSCAAPVERDWRVCPHCAAPLDGAGEGVTPPMRRQDKALGKLLVVIIVVPVVLVIAAIAGYCIRPQGGSASLQKVTFEEYDQLQQSETVRGAVHEWLDEVTGPGQRTDRAYILQYEHSDEFVAENYYFMLVYVPGAGQQSNMGFGVSSGLFSPALVMDLEWTGYDGSLFCVKLKSMRSPMPKITVDGKEIGCIVRNVDYNPTTFYLAPNYTEVEPGDDVFYPERLSVVKLVSNENVGVAEVANDGTVVVGSLKNAGVQVVEDENLMLKILSAIDGGEQVPWEEMPGYDFHDGFEIIVEYKIQDGQIFHPDMARHLVFQEDGVCWLNDDRVRTSVYGGSPYRRMDGDFYGLLEGLFE